MGSTAGYCKTGYMVQKIYTKRGDLGKTSLIGGTKVSKSHLRIDSYGTIDELNSFIGLLSDYMPPASDRKYLKEVQDRLFTIGSALAVDPEKEPRLKIPDLQPEDVRSLEHQMDEMNSRLAALKSFLLPGGHPAVSMAHICRCVCRRAERICVSLQEAEGTVEPLVIQYLNRLSDYFFILARFNAKQLSVDEIIWHPRTGPDDVK
jgi:cob(I)alamin adenosyltransferase